jgi:hypothetical protein
MGLLTFALNVTLDGCCDHLEMVANARNHEPAGYYNSRNILSHSLLQVQ